jgi:hypothetical protein
MNISQRFFFIPLVAVISMLIACDDKPKEWKAQNMNAPTPRLKTVFERTKTVCFGRFLIDVPEAAIVTWADAIVRLGINIEPNGVTKVQENALKFAEELKKEKAIYKNDVPLLISVEDVTHPEGKIVTGYDGFEAVSGLKINGYFRLDEYGITIDSRPLEDRRDEVVAEIKSIARQLRHRSESEIPTECGNCIEYAFLPDKPNPTKEDMLEHIRIGFRLKEFPDAHLSIYVAPSNEHNPEGDSLERQFKRIKEDPMTPEEEKALASTKFFREKPRQIHDWQTGYEVLMRSPDEKGSHSHHDFQVKFIGVPHDPYKPYADIQFQTGVADNAAGATKATLTDEEAIAVWDKITSTIRVRPTTATPLKTTEADPKPRFPIGELAATGRICPQTGWWQTSEPGNPDSAGRQHIKAGERMPHVVSLGEPSVWQKLKGERPSYRSATVWKLVGYGHAPAATDASPQPPTIAHARPDDTDPQAPKKG